MIQTPVVGNAIVLVTVHSSTLAGQIRDAVRDGMRGADKDIDAEGERLGKRFSNSIGNGIRNREDGLGSNIASSVRRSSTASGSRVDDTGSTLGRRFSNSVGRGVRDNENNLGNAVSNSMRRAGRGAGSDFANDLDRGLRAAAPNMRTAGNSAADEVRNGFTNGNNRNRRGILSQFRGLGTDIGKEFNLGIGAARMGPAVIGALAAVGPALVSGLGAILTALAADIVNFAAAIGPGLVGATVLAGAGIATLGLNLGLLKLAFSGTGAQAKAFKAQMADFKETLTSTFAPGVVSGFADLITSLKTTLLPGIGDALKATGLALGDIARGLGETLTSAANMGRINGILATNTAALGKFKIGIQGLVTSFLTLFNAAKPFVDFIAEGGRRFGEWASASLAVSEANGNLSAWMNQALQNFRDLWQVVRDFGRGIANVFKAAAPAGASLLTSIAGIADRFRAWTSDTGNMARMTAFFTKARQLSSAVLGVLGAIFRAGGTAFANMDLGPILHVLDVLRDTVAPAIARIFNQIQTAVGPNLVKIFDNLGVTFTKIADSGVIGKVAEAVSALLLALSKFFATDFGAKVAALGLAFVLFGGVFKPILTAVGALTSAFQAIGPVLAGLSGTAVAIAAAVAAVVAVFILAYTNSEKFRTAISDVWTMLQDNLAPILGVVSEQLGRLWEAVQRLGTALGDFLAPIVRNVIGPALVALGDIAGGAIAVVLENLTLLADFLTGVISGDWQPFTDEVKRLGTVIRGWWDDFTAWFPGAWDTFWNVTLPTALDDFKTWFASEWDTLWSTDVPRVWNTFTGTMGTAWDTFWNTDLPSTWNSFSTWLGAQWSSLLSTDIPNTWNAFVADFGPSWDQFWNTDLPNAWVTFKDKNNTFWNVTLPDVITTGLNGIQTFFADFWTTTIPNIFTKFTDWFTPFWNSWWAEASTGWLDDFDFGKEWPKFWSETVPKAFEDFGTSFGTIWDNFWNVTLPNVAGQLGINLLNAIDDLGGKVGTWWDGFTSEQSTKWDNFWNVTLPEFLTGLPDAVGAKLDDFKTMVGTKWDEFTSWISGLWDGLWGTTLPGMAAKATPATEGVLDGFSAMVGRKWDEFTAWLSGLWDGFWSNTIPGEAEKVTPAVATKMDDFRAMIGRKWDEFTGWLAGLWDGFWSNTIPGEAEKVTPAVATKWDGFRAMVSGKWDEFTGWLSGLWDTFWGSTLPNLVDQIKGAVSGKLDALKTVISGKWEEIKTAVMGVVNGMISDVSALFSGWSFPDIGQLLQDHLVKPFQTAWDDITRLVGQITGATSVLTTAKSALDSANAALGNAIGGQAVPKPPTSTVPIGPVGRPVSILGPEGIGGGLQQMLRRFLDVPGLATGGIVSPAPGGTMFRLGEGGKSERVEPLDNSGLSARDRAMIKSIVASTISMMSGGGVDVNVQIGEQGLDSFVTRTVRREQDSMARRVGKVRR